MVGAANALDAVRQNPKAASPNVRIARTMLSTSNSRETHKAGLGRSRMRPLCGARAPFLPVARSVVRSNSNLFPSASHVQPSPPTDLVAGPPRSTELVEAQPRPLGFL